MSQRCFRSRDTCPVLPPGQLRLYSMRFCQYAHRTRLVLAHKNIQHETINIDLKDKPAWFFERNPLGLVPVLEHDNKVVYESVVCDDYLDTAFPGPSLTPSDPYERARQAIIMEKFKRVESRGAGYKAYRESASEDLNDYKKALHDMEDSLDGNFFGGDNVQMVDLHMWPWFERLGAKPEILAPYPKLQGWVKLMQKQPAVQATSFSPELHLQFIESYIHGTPNYDLGL